MNGNDLNMNSVSKILPHILEKLDDFVGKISILTTDIDQKLDGIYRPHQLSNSGGDAPKETPIDFVGKLSNRVDDLDIIIADLENINSKLNQLI